MQRTLLEALINVAGTGLKPGARNVLAIRAGDGPNNIDRTMEEIVHTRYDAGGMGGVAHGARANSFGALRRNVHTGGAGVTNRGQANIANEFYNKPDVDFIYAASPKRRNEIAKPYRDKAAAALRRIRKEPGSRSPEALAQLRKFIKKMVPSRTRFPY